jgi:hypothetical protein
VKCFSPGCTKHIHHHCAYHWGHRLGLTNQPGCWEHRRAKVRVTRPLETEGTNVMDIYPLPLPRPLSPIPPSPVMVSPVAVSAVEADLLSLLSPNSSYSSSPPSSPNSHLSPMALSPTHPRVPAAVDGDAVPKTSTVSGLWSSFARSVTKFSKVNLGCHVLSFVRHVYTFLSYYITHTTSINIYIHQEANDRKHPKYHQGREGGSVSEMTYALDTACDAYDAVVIEPLWFNLKMLKRFPRVALKAKKWRSPGAGQLIVLWDFPNMWHLGALCVDLEHHLFGFMGGRRVPAQLETWLKGKGVRLSEYVNISPHIGSQTDTDCPARAVSYALHWVKLRTVTVRHCTLDVNEFKASCVRLMDTWRRARLKQKFEVSIYNYISISRYLDITPFTFVLCRALTARAQMMTQVMPRMMMMSY